MTNITDYFEFNHLKQPMRSVSADFKELVDRLALRFKDPNLMINQDEYDAGMRKLLEAKDCFVRSVLPAPK